jgi:hypothetical protein
MTLEQDFERAWLGKFADGITRVAGEDVRRHVMQCSESLSMQSDRRAVIAWSQQAMARLEGLADERQCRTILTGCACQYPKENLRDIRACYARTGDTDLAHQMLQARFEVFLHEVLELESALADEIVRRGWGLAGIKEGRRITATKIPKSGNLLAYLQEQDAERRRQLYCHCPRIREVLQSEQTLSPTYCYCGAGYYQGIWQEIVQQPVEVEVLASVLQGDQVCTISVRLPDPSHS